MRFMLSLLLSGVSGAVIALGSSLLTNYFNRKHQTQEAAADREFQAAENRRSESLDRAFELLNLLAAVFESRRGLFQESWAAAPTIDVTRIEASVRVLPDATARATLEELRHSLTLQSNAMAFLPAQYDEPWDVERQALSDAIQTVAIYLRGEKTPAELAERQSLRNAACKAATDATWADIVSK